MPPSVTDHHRHHHAHANNTMTSGSFFKVREREEGEVQEARQRAAIKWVVAKAYNNSPPREFADPFYRDYKDVERLKPHLVHALATAELYCLAMSHLFQDPNLNNLNHWGIIQALARKGVFVSEPADCALTETVLIQTSPLRMSAHLAVIEALMMLFIRELAPPSRVLSAVRRYSKTEDLPPDSEEALIFWVNQSCQTVRIKLEDEKTENGEGSSSCSLPKFSKLQDLSDFSDGVGLTALLSLYCPDEVSWTEIALGDPPSLADSLANIQLFQRFCQEAALPYNPCHLSTEDIFYMHSSIKLSMECLLADLFTVLETQPARCVQLPGLVKDRIIEVPDPETRLKSPPPAQRPGSGGQRTDSRAGGGEYSSYEDGGEGGAFVVQRGRTIPTLHSVAVSAGHHSHRSLSPGSEVGGTKERLNQDTKSEERGETDTPTSSSTLNRSNSLLEQMRNIQAAGRPSSRAESAPAVKSYAGRRSRRNSTDDNQSQISLENIGGSMENISVLGRNPDKEMRVHSGKRSEIMAAAPAHLRRGSANQQTFDIRTFGGGGSSEGPDNDARMFLDNRELDAMEKMERERRSGVGSRTETYAALSNSNAEDAAAAGGSAPRETKTSFADLRRKSQTHNQFASSGIHINYSSGDTEREEGGRSVPTRRDREQSSGGTAQIAASTRGWEHQAAANNTAASQNGEDALMMSDKFNSVRAKLEERRKRIEDEIRRSKAGEAGGGGGSPAGGRGSSSAISSSWLSERHRPDAAQSPSPASRATRSGSISGGGNSGMEPYLVDHLQEMQSNLQKLAAQQSQIQQMMQSPSHQQQPSPYGTSHPMDPQQLYIPPEQQHQQAPQRRTWGQPQPINFGHQGQGMGMYERPWGQSGPPMYGGGGGGVGGSHLGTGTYSGLPQYDQYGNPIVRDQWVSPGPAGGPLYNSGGGAQPPYDPYNYGQQPFRLSQYGMQQPSPQPPYQGGPYGQQQQGYGLPYTAPPGPAGPGYASVSPSAAPARMTPFRLHDSPSAAYLGGNRSYMHESEPNLSTVGLASTSTPKLGGFSRSSSREQLTAALLSPGRQMSPPPPVRRLHAPVPAPAADDMAPQNISFIDHSTDDNDEEGDGKIMSPGGGTRSDSNLSERLARLNISRGDKTYRVQLHADGREPTALSPEPRSRPTISSTFKERRRGSNEGGSNSCNSGPTSMSGPGSLPSSTMQTKLTEEEIETLNNMKTEVLRETGDPSKGFVISFEDDTPVRPKPVLKERRLSSNKKNSREEKLSSDPVMIMLDMNEDVDSDNRDSSPLRRKISPLRMNGGGGGEAERRGSKHNRYMDSSQWNSYGSDDMKSPDDPVIPRFDVDPAVPLEPMVPLNSSHRHQDASDSSDGGGGSSRLMNTGLIIGDEILRSGDSAPNEMARKKEKIIMQSLKRKQQAEENRLKREEVARRKKEEEAAKAEELERKKEEDQRRREAILEQHKMKKEQEKAEAEGRSFPAPVTAKPVPKIRTAGTAAAAPKRPRPKTIHVDKNDVALGARRLRGSSSNLSHLGSSQGDLRRSESRGSLADSSPTDHRPPSSRSTLSLASMGARPPSAGQQRPSSLLKPASTSSRMGPSSVASSSRRGSTAFINDENDSPRASRAADRSVRSMSQPRGKRDSSVSSAYGGAGGGGMRNDSFRSSRDSLVSRRTYTARRGSNASLYDEEDDYYYGGSLRDVSYGGHSGRRKSSSASYLGPGSLPARHRRLGGGDFDDGASDISSTASGWSAYGYRSAGGGSRMGLYREPAAKSNRTIVMNAIEHVVFPGVVNRDTRMRLMEEIDALDCPHFLLLFRDTKCQFRGLYAYYPDTEEVFKIYGTGPKQIIENMFEKFFKYNSGGKKFTQIHTKSLSVTIDAFTIHNSLWLGKKTRLPDRKDMPLVV